MDNFEKSLINLKETIQDNPLMSQFLCLKEEIHKNKKLMNAKKNIESISHELCKYKSDSRKYISLRKKYEKYLKIYESDPLVINYNQLKPDVENLLKDIKDFLEK